MKETDTAVIEKVTEELRTNPFIWGKVYIPHHFQLQTPPFHVEMIKKAYDNRYFACASPRESAKSTIIALLLPLHAICFKIVRFLLLISNTYSKAAETLETIKREVRENETLKEDFPIELWKDAEGDTIFRHKDGYCIRVLCKGGEQMGAVRGVKFSAWRPDMIIVDDIEDDELVRSPERRRKLKEDFDQALIPAGDRKLCKYRIIGTILHDDSLMAKLVSKSEYPEYTKLFYQAKTGNHSLWPQKWTTEWLEWLEKEKPAVYAKEYQNDPSCGLMSCFNVQDFRRWEVQDKKYLLFDDEGRTLCRDDISGCRAVIACDLAWEEKRESDYTVIMPVLQTPQNELLIEDYICKKGVRPHEFEEIIFAMEMRFRSLTGKTVYVGFEKAKLEKVIRWLLTQAMKKRDHYLCLKDIIWDGDKIQRIETRLEGRYSTHMIFHKRGMGELENQLLRVRSGIHDDLPDALQGAVQMFDFRHGQVKKTKPVDDKFERLRRFAIESRFPSKAGYMFGIKKTQWGIPSKVCPI